MEQNIMYYFHDYWYDFGDSRTKHFIFAHQRTPWLILWAMANYLLYATVVGPKLMEKREAYQLKLPMIAYNISMAFANAVFFMAAITRCEFGKRFLDFKYPDINDMSADAMLEIHWGYLYWISKLVDLTDTFFFVLRKKQNQISFLHLYHHTVVPIFGWLLIVLNPLCPGCFLFAIINSFIHVVMYSYYALSAIGPNIQKYLWWKKYITVMQLWQFLIYGLYGVVMYFFQTGYPAFWFYVGLTQPPLFYMLFHNFYQNSYRKKPKQYDNNNEKVKRVLKIKKS